jgi:hypothetical protein
VFQHPRETPFRTPESITKPVDFDQLGAATGPGRRSGLDTLRGIVNLSRGGILLPSVARRFGAEKSLAPL